MAGTPIVGKAHAVAVKKIDWSDYSHGIIIGVQGPMAQVALTDRRVSALEQVVREAIVIYVPVQPLVEAGIQPREPFRFLVEANPESGLCEFQFVAEIPQKVKEELPEEQVQFIRDFMVRKARAHDQGDEELDKLKSELDGMEEGPLKSVLKTLVIRQVLGKHGN